MRIEAKIPKKSCQQGKILQIKNARRFYTFHKQKFSNLRPLLPIIFPPRILKKKNGHQTSGSMCKKTFKRIEKKKNNTQQNTFLPRQFYTLYEQQFSNLRPLLSIIFFPKIPKIKKVCTLEFGKWGQKIVKKTPIPKKSSSLRQNFPKTNFFLSGDFTPFISKSIQI